MQVPKRNLQPRKLNEIPEQTIIASTENEYLGIPWNK
jgi:hypothetical protein